MPQSNQQDSKPSAPQAESVPSGKEAARETLFKVTFIQRKDGEEGYLLSAGKIGVRWQPSRDGNTEIEKLAALLNAELASQTAAVRAERDQADRHFVEIAEDNAKLRRRAEAAERSNSLLRERMNAIEKILRENERDGYGYCKNCAQFAPDHDENCWLAILLHNKENQ